MNRFRRAWRALRHAETSAPTGGMPPGSDGLGVDLTGNGGHNAPPSAVASAFAIIKLLSGVEGTLPRTVQERDDLARRPVRAPEYEMLWGRPNTDWDTAASAFWVSVFAHLEGWNNSYLWKRRVGTRVIGLELMHPSEIAPSRNEAGRKEYRLRGELDKVYGTEDILHIHGLSFDGVSGVSPVRASVESHEHAILLDRFGRQFLRNGARPSGVMSVDERLDEADYEEWEDAWSKQNSGSGNAGRTILIGYGAKYQSLSVPPEEAQYLQSRQFTREEILGIYAPGLPHHLIGWKSNTSNFGTGVEAQARHLAAFVLVNRLDLVADALSLALLPPELEIEFRLERLLRSDPKVLAEVYHKMRMTGTASREDWRMAQGLAPMEDMPDDIIYGQSMKIVALGGEELLYEPEQEEPDPADFGNEALMLAYGHCSNHGCESRADGRPGRLMARRVGEQHAVCDVCGEITWFLAGETPRDTSDVKDATAERVARYL